MDSIRESDAAAPPEIPAISSANALIGDPCEMGGVKLAATVWGVSGAEASDGLDAGDHAQYSRWRCSR
jgi:hypothetical protein